MPRPRTTPNADALHEAIRRAARRELEVRRALPDAIAALAATLLPWQRRVYESTARRIVMHPGRRSGKTHVMGAKVFRAAVEHPGSTIPIFERTTTCQAAVVLWKSLQEANTRHGLGMDFHHSLLRARLPNRSEIIIVGADTVEAADKARGNAYPVAFVDEAGTFRPHILDYLIHDVLDAALLDYQGQLVLAGTPPPRWSAAHPFYVASHSDGWERVHATFMDNDALPLNMGDARPEERRAVRESEFAAMLVRNGWTRDTPRVQREWMGRWIQDDESLLYRLGEANVTDGFPEDVDRSAVRWALGIDFGFNDPTAFVVVGRVPGDSRIWVPESYEATGLIPSAVAAHIERLKLRYDFRFIVGDSGGAGKPYAEELRQSFGLPIESAKKHGTEAYIELMNGDLSSGAVQIFKRTNQDLLEDLQTVRRDPETGTAEDADHDATHIPDALRYVLSELHARGGLGDRDQPARGTREYLEAEERRLEAAMVDQYRRQQHGDQDGVWSGPTLDDAVSLLHGA